MPSPTSPSPGVSFPYWEMLRGFGEAVSFIGLSLYAVARPWRRERAYQLLAGDKDKHANFVFDILADNPDRHRAIINKQFQEEFEMSAQAAFTTAANGAKLTEMVELLKGLDRKITRVVRKSDRMEGWLAASNGHPIPKDEDETP